MTIDRKFKTAFVDKLLAWYRENKRDLPWRRTSDPYRIWLSEIMLQQTQVESVIPYYKRFLQRFPDLRSLADANLSDVLKVWEGLGYYARARNLLNAAQMMIERNGGAMPRTHDELIKIPGIGPYTAAAVASIAFNEHYPVVDGNVLRVLARLFKIEEAPGKKGTKTRFVETARALLPKEKASDFNQAMMELGALICLPVKPKCDRCPVDTFCKAFQTMDNPAVLPVKAPPRNKPHYDVVVGIIWNKGKLFIDQRPTDGLLGGLWEFPGGKKEQRETLEECLEREILEELGIKVRVQGPFMTVRHAYTHFKVTIHSFQCQLLNGKPKPKKAIDWKWVTPEEIAKYPFPQANKKILDALLENL